MNQARSSFVFSSGAQQIGCYKTCKHVRWTSRTVFSSVQSTYSRRTMLVNIQALRSTLIYIAHYSTRNCARRCCYSYISHHPLTSFLYKQLLESSCSSAFAHDAISARQCNIFLNEFMSRHNCAVDVTVLCLYHQSSSVNPSQSKLCFMVHVTKRMYRTCKLVSTESCPQLVTVKVTPTQQYSCLQITCTRSRFAEQLSRTRYVDWFVAILLVTKSLRHWYVSCLRCND